MYVDKKETVTLKSSKGIKCHRFGVGRYFLDKRRINHSRPWRWSWHLPNDRGALYGPSYTLHLACLPGSWLWLTSCPLSHYHSKTRMDQRKNGMITFTRVLLGALASCYGAYLYSSTIKTHTYNYRLVLCAGPRIICSNFAPFDFYHNIHSYRHF